MTKVTGFITGITNKKSVNKKNYALVFIDGKIVGSDWNKVVSEFSVGQYVEVETEASGQYHNIVSMREIDVPQGVEAPSSPSVSPTTNSPKTSSYSKGNFSVEGIRMNAINNAMLAVNESCKESKSSSTPRARVVLAIGIASLVEKYIKTGSLDDSEVGSIKEEKEAKKDKK